MVFCSECLFLVTPVWVGPSVSSNTGSSKEEKETRPRKRQKTEEEDDIDLEKTLQDDIDPKQIVDEVIDYIKKVYNAMQCTQDAEKSSEFKEAFSNLKKSLEKLHSPQLNNTFLRLLTTLKIRLTPLQFVFRKGNKEIKDVIYNFFKSSLQNIIHHFGNIFRTLRAEVVTTELYQEKHVSLQEFLLDSWGYDQAEKAKQQNTFKFFSNLVAVSGLKIKSSDKEFRLLFIGESHIDKKKNHTCFIPNGSKETDFFKAFELLRTKKIVWDLFLETPLSIRPKERKLPLHFEPHRKHSLMNQLRDLFS